MRLAACLILVAGVLSTSMGAGAASGHPLPRSGVIDAPLARSMLRAPGAMQDVIVMLRSRADLDQIAARSDAVRLRRIVLSLQATAASSQAGLLARLEAWRADGSVRRIRPLWVINGIGLRATPAVIGSIAAMPEVRSVSVDATVAAPATSPAPTAPAEPNLTVIGAPALWARGLTGGGVVVANMDSGVSLSHADLAAAYRGGNDSWFDPSGQHATPADLLGHGTQTMSVVVGGGAGGTQIGVAPGASWIAAKIFNDSGVATTTGIHAAFQWLLDPDGNAATADAPDVVLGSWTTAGPSCDLTFEPDLEALRAAGILPVFAAGNSGPSVNTSFSPANNPAAFSVGATDNGDVIAPFSSRGPSTCGQRTGAFPDVVAPGVDVATEDLFGQFATASGTSVSAPHAAGVAALLLQAFPSASTDTLSSAMRTSAHDLGSAGPDDTYGNGRLDAPAAYDALAGVGAPAPVLLSIHAGAGHTLGTVTGVQKKDVVSFDGSAYAMVFDGSDVGLGGANVDAFDRLGPSTFLMSFDKPLTLPGVGAVDDSDIVRFAASSVGPATTGSFSMWFDGSDVGLSTNAEDVDAVAVLGDGRVVLSTTGHATPTGLAGAEDEDLIVFAPKHLGPTTAGTFATYLDGSDVGLSAGTEDVDAVDVRATGEIDLSTTGAFAVSGLSGDGEDVFTCVPITLGATSACSYAPTLVVDGSAVGLAGLGVDAFGR